MKHTKLHCKIVLGLICVFLIFGCGKTAQTEKVPNKEQENNSDLAEAKEEETSVSDFPTEAMPSEEKGDETIDYDLTTMGSDMVYATVYQLLSEPDTAEGKTIRMDGTYQAVVDDTTGKRYDCCIIADALGCCSQGLEFVWDDGSHIYPQEYPNDGDAITVTGIFHSYQEEGDDRMYVHLTDAELSF